MIGTRRREDAPSGAVRRRGAAARGAAVAGAMAMAIGACGGEPGGRTHAETDVSATEDATVAGATAGTVVAEAEGIRVVRGARSEPRLAGARARILAPAPDAAVEGPEVEVRLGVAAFEPGAMTPGAEERGIAVSPDGQHVHLILDDGAYHAVYDVSGPVRLEDVPPGPHVLFAFPSRAWHESVKEEGALAVVPFRVGEPGEGAAAAPGAVAGPALEGPILVYSRPKGAYAGADADSVMVDFYLANVVLAPDGHTVRLTVDGAVSARLTAWVPYYLVGLPTGEHAIALELLDPVGEPVEGLFARDGTTITVER
ncbi:MAG: hypothetical protein R6X22_13550 [Gemmatimonadota bacterium]